MPLASAFPPKPACDAIAAALQQSLFRAYRTRITPHSSCVKLRGLEHLRDPAVSEIPTELMRVDDDDDRHHTAKTDMHIPDAATIGLLKTKREQRRAAESELFIPLRSGEAEERSKYGESRLVREDDEDDGAFAESTPEAKHRLRACVYAPPCLQSRSLRMRVHGLCKYIAD